MQQKRTERRSYLVLSTLVTQVHAHARLPLHARVCVACAQMWKNRKASTCRVRLFVRLSSSSSLCLPLFFLRFGFDGSVLTNSNPEQQTALKRLCVLVFGEIFRICFECRKSVFDWIVLIKFSCRFARLHQQRITTFFVEDVNFIFKTFILTISVLFVVSSSALFDRMQKLCEFCLH